MGWDCMVAAMKVKQRFGQSGDAISGAIRARSPGEVINTNSCAATAQVLGETICPGRTHLYHSLTQPESAQFDPAKAVETMSRLLTGDEAIFVQMSPTHYFTVLPVSDRQVAMFQGFQSYYSLYDWIATSGKAMLDSDVFLTRFRSLLSGTQALRTNAAVALFSTPACEAAMAVKYANTTFVVKAISSSPPDLFVPKNKKDKKRLTKATLAD